MNANENPILQDAILAIKARFQRELHSQIEFFDNYLICIETGHETAKALEGIRQKSHKIHGVAETLGLKELGDLGARVESMAAELFLTTRSSSRVGELVSLVEEMIEHMQRLQR